MKFSIQILFLGCLTVATSTPLFKIDNTTDAVDVLKQITNASDEVDASARIVNGYEVDVTEVPYQGSLRRRAAVGWGHICGVVVIRIRAVLTAGHCAYGYENNPSVLRVVVGTVSRLTGGKSYDISHVIIHEAYDSSTLQNDIAILGTAKKMSFSSSINPISIASSDFTLLDGTEALVSGFGTTSYQGSSSSVLLATTVFIINQDSCARTYYRMATITSGMLCACARDPPRDACQGDSGGPLVFNHNLIGIVSWGEGCADSIYPGVYTRVSLYSSWIGQNVANVFD